MCVGCDGLELTKTFSKRLRLTSCLLAYLEEGHGPRWGQLGCNGFILLDAEGRVACRKTAPFLEQGEAAFVQAESLLRSLLPLEPARGISAGRHVELRGLSSPEMNGTRGYVIEKGEATSCVILTYRGKRVEANAENVRFLDESEGQEEGGEESRQEANPSRKQQKSEGGGEGGARSSEAARGTEVAPLMLIDSVGVAQLDAEHERCVLALSVLNSCPSREAIEAVIEAYRAHFANEEALLDTHLYAGAVEAHATGGFSADASARRSHFADHARMLSELQQAAQGLTSEESRVPASFVDDTLRSFERHANTYDAAYAERLAARLREPVVTSA